MKILLIMLLSLFVRQACGQSSITEINKGWQFSKAGSNKWYAAKVPGTVYTDLLANKLIPDPFYADNEKQLQWIDTGDWAYRTTINCDSFFDRHLRAELSFKGLDTYADVFINGQLVLQADNMFRGRSVQPMQYFHRGKNELKIVFHSAKKHVAQLARNELPLIRPDNNRVYARKAQFQFGWDWGPTFINCGIWKPIILESWGGTRLSSNIKDSSWNVKLVQEKDSIGTSFYFEKDGNPVYAKGANWIPANIFPASVTHDDYRKLLLRAKDAHMNMLRVWGGGVYEDDYFYDLCDSLGIMVWQDFMFAGGMYPASKEFLASVKEEVKYQIDRLKHHPCIVLWCGNNEIDEAWHNWCWQDQFNIHGADSARLWQDYKTLFVDSLAAWVKEFDGNRPYISSSPKYGWGHKESFTEGDSHYWGLWWGLEPWEAFESHTGRFVSEYGMQSMSNYNTVKSYVPANDPQISSAAVQAHQKANDGFKKLNYYLEKYFIDSAKFDKLSLEEYTYLTHCLQYYVLKNSIVIHRSSPRNMGTLLWQLNDCWPATSWSITDFSREPKAAWYAVREAYRDDVKPQKDSLYPKELHLDKPVFKVKSAGDSRFIVSANTAVKYVCITSKVAGEIFSDNYFDLRAEEEKIISVDRRYLPFDLSGQFKFMSLYDIFNK